MNNRSLFLIFGLLLAVAFTIAGPTRAQETPSPPSTPAKQAEPAAVEGSYKIGKGDVLDIHVWKEPDLSKETFVRMDGMMSLPLLNDVQASGRTPMQLKEDIEKRLNEFVEDTSVTVIVKVPASQKYYILGEIGRTGEYDLLKDLTVLQAFARAGGFTEWAAKTRIILLRIENGKEKIITINYKDIIKGKDFSQNVPLKTNDTIIVP
ncbi:MAG: polysaccharide biosynthesis/export family protein [Thermodesulfobacteriota bacterium]|nr:polysaccharide biosynthesis/export family protein [Thermodesulfobacteriota bacterium]